MQANINIIELKARNNEEYKVEVIYSYANHIKNLDKVIY